MKIIIIKDKLKDAVDTVSRATGDHPTLSVLKHILIEAKDDVITLTGTNLEMGMQYKAAGKVSEEGSITLPASLLAQLLGTLNQDRISFESTGSLLEVSAENYSGKIQGGPAEEFPLIPKINEEQAVGIEIDGTVLREALEEVLSAAQFSELRPELNSVLIKISLGKMTIVATDSFRLAEKTLGDNEFTSENAEEFQMLVPLKSAQEILRLSKIGGPAKLRKDGNQLLFTTDGVEFISRLLETNFPDYQAIIPKEFQAECTVSKEDLIAAVKLGGVMSSSFEVRLRSGDKEIEVMGQDDKLGENTSRVPAKLMGEFKDISFNGRYLQDGLRVLPGKEVTLSIAEESRPAMLRSARDDSFFYIVMPILKG
jgi:DNA polymerase-3 subunit beta